MKTYLTFFSLFILLTSCGNKNEANKLSKDVVLTPPPPVDQTIGVADIAVADKKQIKATKEVPEDIDTSKKIINEGEIRFQTGNLKLAREKIVSSLKSLGGFVGEENETNNGDNNQKEYDLKIRVPSQNFDKFLNALSANADHIDTKNIRRRDVTTDFIDIASQLKNKKLLEERYLDLLKRASRTKDLLDIEDKLTDIRSDIEATQGKLNYLASQVTYSSLDITFYHKLTAEAADEHFSRRFKTAMTEGWGILENLFFTLIAVWPLLIIGVVTLWILKKWTKRRSKKIITE